MKVFYKIFILFLFLTGCATPNPLKDMRFQPISSSDYTVASWYKITKTGMPLKVYIEGDGHSFDRKGLPTDDPTPEGLFLRQLAVDDPSPNVVYLARPCQYLMSTHCSQKDWTTGRFSEQIVGAMEASVGALMKKAKTQKVILIGYSGGGMIASQIAVRHPKDVKELITIAGVLNHKDWTTYHGDLPLVDSIDLDTQDATFKSLKQIHYVGQKDTVVPIELSEKWVDAEHLFVVKKASHEKGFDTIYKKIWAER